MALETSLHSYADVLDSIRDEIDITGSQIPVYSVALKKSAQISLDAQRAADDLEKLTDVEINVPIMGTIQPFGAMKAIARDLREFLPQFSRSLSAAEKSLSGYTPENHEKLIDSIDKTILLLKINADKLEEQAELIRKCICGFMAVCIIAAIAHGGLALAILLFLPSKTPPVAPRRQVSFM